MIQYCDGQSRWLAEHDSDCSWRTEHDAEDRSYLLTPQSSRPLTDLLRRDQTDELLIRAIQAQSPAALDQLHVRYRDFVHKLAYDVVLDWDDAQEVLQDVFLQIWNRAKHFDKHRGKVKGWIAGLTQSRAIDLHRRNRRWRRGRDAIRVAHESGNLQSVFVDSRSSSGASSIDESAFLLNMVSTLPPEQEQVVIMTYFMNMSQRAIAKHTGQTLGVIKHRLILAMRAMKEKLEDFRPELSYVQ